MCMVMCGSLEDEAVHRPCRVDCRSWTKACQLHANSVAQYSCGYSRESGASGMSMRHIMQGCSWAAAVHVTMRRRMEHASADTSCTHASTALQLTLLETAVFAELVVPYPILSIHPVSSAGHQHPRAFLL